MTSRASVAIEPVKPHLAYLKNHRKWCPMMLADRTGRCSLGSFPVLPAYLMDLNGEANRYVQGIATPCKVWAIFISCS